MPEMLTVTPVLQESPGDTLARLAAIANQTAYREIEALQPYAYSGVLGQTSLRETVISHSADIQPDPKLDHAPLTTRRYDNDLATMERVLAGLRKLPSTEQVEKTSDEAQREKALALIARVRDIHARRHVLRPAVPAPDAPVAPTAEDTLEDRKLREAGFDLSGERMKMSPRLARQLAINPKGEYHGLRQRRETIPARVIGLTRRLGNLMLRNKLVLGASTASVYAGVDLVLTQMQR